ncbi:MAG: PhnD/SsuA/transferrin family substrate-binding protein [Ectothiorhodospiraceae bacterium]|nr:PhnD/SsuA/transferrin family substrate-binding protein [Ectothiorhodospiraceae bacterium]
MWCPVKPKRCQFHILLVLISIFALNSVAIAQQKYKTTVAASNSEKTLTLGIFPRRNALATIKLFTPLTRYLSEKLDRNVKLVVSKDFSTFWENVSLKKYDIVHFNQYHYVVSHKNYGYEVILKNVEFGEATIAGSIIVRKDSGINSVMDLKGKKVVFGGGPKTMQSYIIARYLLEQGSLEQGGLKHSDYIEDFAKNPPNAIFSAFYKQSDAAGSGDKVLHLKVVTKRTDSTKMKYLMRGEQLPHLPWAVHTSLPPGTP